MTTSPDTKLLKDPKVLTISLDDVDWPVPKMAPRQNEIIVPLILQTLPRIMRAMDSYEVEIDGKKETRSRINLASLADALTTQGIKDLDTIVYWALERGHPGLTPEEFDEMSVGVMDAVEATLVIAKQTGVIRQGKAGDPKPGEAKAATNQ